MTDQVLLEGYLINGDDKAVLQLLENYEPFMNYISNTPIRNFKTNKDEKDELKSDLVVYFLESLPHYNKDIGTFKVFIENKLRNYGRKAAKKLMKYKNSNVFTDNKEMDKFEELPEEIEEFDLTYSYVEELIDRLPPRQSQVARLRILENYRFFQIAHILYPTKDSRLAHSIVNKNFKEASYIRRPFL
jgi:DNA-directed RNA polymerase specialized sigma24 family protein